MKGCCSRCGKDMALDEEDHYFCYFCEDPICEECREEDHYSCYFCRACEYHIKSCDTCITFLKQMKGVAEPFICEEMNQIIERTKHKQ